MQRAAIWISAVACARSQVISEVSTYAGDDLTGSSLVEVCKGKQWVEIYNPADTQLNITGMYLANSSADLSAAPPHVHALHMGDGNPVRELQREGGAHCPRIIPAGGFLLLCKTKGDYGVAVVTDPSVKGPGPSRRRTSALIRGRRHLNTCLMSACTDENVGPAHSGGSDLETGCCCSVSEECTSSCCDPSNWFCADESVCGGGIGDGAAVPGDDGPGDGADSAAPADGTAGDGEPPPADVPPDDGAAVPGDDGAGGGGTDGGADSAAPADGTDGGPPPADVPPDDGAGAPADGTAGDGEPPPADVPPGADSGPGPTGGDGAGESPSGGMGGGDPCVYCGIFTNCGFTFDLNAMVSRRGC